MPGKAQRLALEESSKLALQGAIVSNTASSTNESRSIAKNVIVCFYDTFGNRTSVNSDYQICCRVECEDSVDGEVKETAFILPELQGSENGTVVGQKLPTEDGVIFQNLELKPNIGDTDGVFKLHFFLSDCSLSLCINHLYAPFTFTTNDSMVRDIANTRAYHDELIELSKKLNSRLDALDNELKKFEKIIEKDLDKTTFPGRRYQ